MKKTTSAPQSLPNDNAADAKIGLLSWQLPASIAFVCCIVISVYHFFAPLYSNMLLAFVLFPASMGVLALLLYTRPYFKYAEVRIMTALFVWMMIGLILNNWRLKNALTSPWFYCVCASTFLCFSLPYAFDKETLKKALSVFAVVMLVCAAALCAAGLYVVLSGCAVPEAITNLGKFGISSEGRLYLLVHPNTVAPICGTAILLSGYLFTRTRKWFLKVFLIFGIVLFYCTMALTDSRTGIFSTSIGVALEIFLFANVSFTRIKHSFARVLISAVAALLILCAFVIGISLVRAAYNGYVASAETAAETAASAKTAETAAEEAASRGMTNADTFSGRTDIWLGTLKGLSEHPDLLLTGATPLLSSSIMAQYFPKGSPVGNFHNTYLASLVSFGIPGVVVILAFLVLLAIASAKLSFTNLKDADSLGVRLMPALLLFALPETMMEAFLFVEISLNVIWVWFLFTAGFVFRMQKSE